MTRVFLLSLLCGVSAFGQLALLPFRPVGLEYSYTLDRFIAISSTPDQVHIYDPVSKSDTQINLPKAPLSISVSPDGKFAAVGHDALVSYVDLTSASVRNTFAINGTARAIVLSADYIYTSTGTIQIATGKITGGAGWSTYPRLHPTLKAIYNTRDSTSPNDIEKTDISAGTVGSHTDSPYHGDYSVCGGVWFSPDGKRAYTGCATVFATTSDTLDMTYKGSLENLSTIVALDDSAAQRKIAAIPQGASVWPYGAGQTDSEFRLFDSATMRPLGTFRVPDFALPAKSYPVHGKWIFFSSNGQTLYFVGQVDTASGLQNDYAVYTWSVANQPACSVTFTPSSSVAVAPGEVITASITAAADCTYQVDNDVSWVKVVAGRWGSGNATLSVVVRPNTGAASRTVTLRAGSATHTITQDGAPAVQPVLTRVSVNLVDAEYSKALNKVVAVSAGPDELHLFDPLTRTDSWLTLTYRPLSVSVRPDGLVAAIGHDGWITLVDLPTLTVLRTYEMYTDVNDIVLAGNGYMYAFPRRSWSDIYAVEVATGKITPISAIYDGRIARLHASGKYLYVGDSWHSKWDISVGTLKPAPDSAGYYGISLCGNLWLTEDGQRLIGACGKVYRTSEVTSDDLQYNGQFSDVGTAAWAAHSTARQSTAVAVLNSPNSSNPVNEVQFYGDAYLALSGKYSVPKLAVGNALVTETPAYLFWDKTSAGVVMLTKADDNARLASPWALTYLSPDVQSSGCAYVLGASSPMPAAGGFSTLSLNSGTGCFWSASSNASWLRVTSGGFGTGYSNIGLYADSNPTNVARTATVSVGSATIRVTQAAGTLAGCTYGLTASTWTVSTNGGNNSFGLMVTPSGCAWTASSNASWLQVFPLSGTGPAPVVSLTAYPNFSTSSRTAVITIGGRTFTATQAGSAATANERFVTLLYFGFFGRLPSAGELAFQAQALNNGTARAAIAVNFMTSAELAQGGKYVGGLYLGLLNRDAEYSGWLFQRNAMVTGQVTPRALVGNFIGSLEFGLLFGSPGNAEYTRILYRNILGREPTQAEVDFQAGALSGGLSRDALGYNFLSSAEFRIRTNAKLETFLLYTGLLGRNPTSAEAASTSSAIQASGLQAAIQTLLATPEFMALTQ